MSIYSIAKYFDKDNYDNKCELAELYLEYDKDPDNVMLKYLLLHIKNELTIQLIIEKYNNHREESVDQLLNSYLLGIYGIKNSIKE